MGDRPQNEEHNPQKLAWKLTHKHWWFVDVLPFSAWGIFGFPFSVLRGNDGKKNSMYLFHKLLHFAEGSKSETVFSCIGVGVSSPKTVQTKKKCIVRGKKSHPWLGTTHFYHFKTNSTTGHLLSSSSNFSIYVPLYPPGFSPPRKEISSKKVTWPGIIHEPIDRAPKQTGWNFSRIIFQPSIFQVRVFHG